ncbi:MAG: peptidylprolyl isomerase [Pseudomonadota bacterium]
MSYKNPDDTVIIELEKGDVVIELRPDVAPAHVARIKQLVQEKFYDGIVFHRVIDGFMAQTGDPTGTGRGGSDLPDLKQEFSAIAHTRGAVSMARSSSPDSANSQFFICFNDQSCRSLDGQYTYFGQVIKGMKYIDQIKKGQGANGMVQNPDKIITMRMAKTS